MECLAGIDDRCCLSYLVFNVLTALVSNYNVCLNLFFFFLSFPIGFSVMLVVKLTESCLKKKNTDNVSTFLCNKQRSKGNTLLQHVWYNVSLSICTVEVMYSSHSIL